MTTDEIMAALAAVDVERLAGLMSATTPAPWGTKLTDTAECLQFHPDLEQWERDLVRRNREFAADLVNAFPAIRSLLREIPQMVEVVKAAEQMEREWSDRSFGFEDLHDYGLFKRLRAALGRIK